MGPKLVENAVLKILEDSQRPIHYRDAAVLLMIQGLRSETGLAPYDEVLSLFDPALDPAKSVGDDNAAKMILLENEYIILTSWLPEAFRGSRNFKDFRNGGTA